MCGIAAIFAYDASAPNVDEGELVTIREAMSPRGPDGCGLWWDAQRRVGLAQRRLAIIDLSPAGAQPMWLVGREIGITFNGEIYNYRELRAQLEQRGHHFQSGSDTEVLLHLYAEHGPTMVAELRGMYTFAIWDGEKRGLFLARDPLGIKPLYLSDDGKTLRAASQIKALLAGGQIEQTLDPAGQVGFLLWGHVPEPFTLHRKIRALPAGSTLWVGADGSRSQKDFDAVHDAFADAEAGAGPAVDLAERLRDTVAHHLIADVPVGVFLSAGLDSTTLAALAAEQGGTLRTVTLGFEEFRGSPEDEAPVAESVARVWGAQHQTIRVTRRDFQEHRENIFKAMDRPSIDGVNTYFVSLAARRAGLKVALSGLGGDELFGGYPSFAEIPKSVRALGWLGAPSVMGRAVRIMSAPLLRRFTSPKYAGLLEYGGSASGAYLLRRGLFMPWELPQLMDADVLRAGWKELQPLLRLDATVAKLRSPRAVVSALEMTWYMRNQLLNDADWAGMAHSLEIRVPLVDVVLLRSLAGALVGTRPPGKRDLANAPARKLPPEILGRPKTGFRVPVRDWLMAAQAPDRASDPAAANRGLRGWAREVYSHFAQN